MEKVSINMNPNSWNNSKVKGLRLSSMNIRSLHKHIQDIREDALLMKSDMICLQETWLETRDKTDYDVNGYELHLNSQGRGKGLAIYFKEGLFEHVKDVKKPNLQISKMSAERIDVIVVYRSKDESYMSVKSQIETLLNLNKTTILDKNELSEYFKKEKFTQQVIDATHIKGSILDQVHLRRINMTSKIEVDICPTYYTYDDHDMINVLLHK